MASGGCAARALQGLVLIAIIGVVGTWALVSYARSCIQRDARWVGMSFTDGIALVFACEPRSGTRRAYFHLWPWKKTELEKIDSGA